MLLGNIRWLEHPIVGLHASYFAGLSAVASGTRGLTLSTNIRDDEWFTFNEFLCLLTRCSSLLLKKQLVCEQNSTSTLL